MYQSHFGLRHRPFRSSPDCARYYPATNHEHALAQLLQALADEEGCVLLTGNPGSGKTLLCHCLLQRRDAESRSAFLTNSHLPDRKALLQAILYELSLPHEGRSEQELRLALTDDLLSHCAEGRPTLLIVDEAHHLAPGLLEELRLLTNLESGQGRAFQVLLVGQPLLLETVTRPELAAFAQRLAVRTQLEALAEAEAADYLLHQLRLAGADAERVLPGETLALLACGSKGIPRLLNQAAHRALLFAQGSGATEVDVEAAMEALLSLGLSAELPGEEGTGEEREEEQFPKTAPVWVNMLTVERDRETA